MLILYLHYSQIIQTNEVQKQNGLDLYTTLPPRDSGLQRLTPVKNLRMVKKGKDEEEAKGRAYKQNF